jgi:4-hydroxy-tetrahydrodipicolinate synthase
MTAPFQPHGTWTAMVTPFDANGMVDHSALKRLVEFQIAQGITGLVPVGTTGESPTLSWEEHIRVIEAAVRIAHSRVGVLAGTGSNSTQEAIEATRHAAHAGASAALLMDCYYNGPSSLELRTEYYEPVARAVPEIPLVPYIIPGRTGTALSAEDLAILHGALPKRFPAVKEATGDLARMRQDRACAGESLAILSGDDDLTLAMMQDPQIHASGVISVMSNIVPGPLGEMVKAFRSGDIVAAKTINTQLEPIFKFVTCKAPGTRTLPGGKVVTVEDKFRNPLPIKMMMAGLGMPVGLCRQPLGKMSKSGVELCRAALRAVHKANPALLAPVAQAFGVNIEQRIESDAAWAAVTRN